MKANAFMDGPFSMRRFMRPVLSLRTSAAISMQIVD